MNTNKFHSNLCILSQIAGMIAPVVGIARSIALQSFAYFVGTLILTAVLAVVAVYLDALVDETKDNL